MKPKKVGKDNGLTQALQKNLPIDRAVGTFMTH